MPLQLFDPEVTPTLMADEGYAPKDENSLSWAVSTTFSGWNAAGNPGAATDALGGRTEYEWDDNLLDLVSLRQYPEGDDGDALTTEWTWMPLVGVTSVTSPSGKTESYGYDRYGRLSAVSNSDGCTVSEYDYHIASGPLDRNRIRNRSYRTTTIFSDDVTYYNGLGYPSQDIAVGGGGDGYDIVTPYSYDGLLRPDRNWLPFPVEDNDGEYVNGAFSACESWYADIYDEYEYPWSETVSEFVPDGRPLREYIAGADYRGHPSSFSYLANLEDDIPALYSVCAGGQLYCRGYYGAGTLTGVRTVDGDGRTSTVWSDREGRTVCEERSLVENGDTTAVRTLYAYDSRGNLGWTVTPEGYGPLMEAIADYDPEEHDYAFFSVRPDDGFAFKYCYVYERDSRGRVVIKHIPGKGPETFTYDDLDRVVTSQDGNQRADGITVHYEYDGIGRPVGRTVVKAGVSREMESAVYDPCTGLKTSESLAMLMPDGWVERTPSLFRTYEYDSEERVSRVVENDGDNVHTKTFTYDLAGNVLTKSEHNAKGNGESVTVTTSCTYDSRNRQTGETVRVDGALRSSVARSYDELGCLSLTTYGTGANAICEYSGYTLNGWLESKSSPLLSQVWLYADGAYPSYTGSISMEWWRHGSSSQPGTVHFHYDSLGRLTGSEMSGQGNRWSERNISYDLCGNVLCLDRYRDDASIPADVLRFTYTGARRDGWGYDPNGNVSFDPLRNFEISHNLLNLPCEVRIGPDPAYNEEGLDEGDVVSAFEFYSDGTLHGVIDGQDGYYDSKYIGSLIYKGEPGEESFEGVQFADGFIPANGGAAQYFLRDHLGSVRVVATDCSTVVRRTDYLPFGVRMSGDGLIAGGGYQARFGFGGKENVMGDVWEPGEGHWSVGERYQHFGARTYDPVTCTFLQIDPMAKKYCGMSPYGYCAGNPVNLVDPDGKVFDNAVDVGFVLYDLGAAVYEKIRGNDAAASSHLKDAVADAAAALIPGYTAAATHLVRGVTKGANAAKAADKVADAGRVTGTISNAESPIAHMRRGRESEARVLNDAGLSKNTTPYTVKVEGKDVTTIPDSMQGGVYEVKDTKSVYNTQQIKAERQLAEDKGVTFSVFVGEKTHVSTNISSGELIRRKDLGPK